LVRQNKVDGLVLIIAELRDEDKEVLAKRKIPVVLVNSKPLELSSQVDALPTYFTDNQRGGALAANHLLDRGCRTLLCLADAIAGPEMLDRTIGFEAAVHARGFTSTTLAVSADFESTHRFVLDHSPFDVVDGIFCHTDVMACAALRALQERGRSVPDEVKLVGYDDIELGTYFTPALTTIHQPREEIARLACRHLADALASRGNPILHRSVEPSLVIRGST
jgi:LacI family transcriptional regulator